MARTSFNISYMLKNKLWKKIINNKDGSSKGILCIICAQLRLGRKVKPSDFKDVPLNLRDRGMLWMLFPQALKNHMSKFVEDEAADLMEDELSKLTEDDLIDYQGNPMTKGAYLRWAHLIALLMANTNDEEE